MTRRYVVFAFCLAAVLHAAAATAQSEPKDHPLVSRYPGSTIETSTAKEFDEYDLILGPSQGKDYKKTQHLEGRVTIIKYKNPANRSTLEIIRNYQQALAQSGFQTLF